MSKPDPGQSACAVAVLERADDLEHWYCPCRPNLSLCGRDISDLPEEDFEEANCVVCEAMVDGPCPYCGEVL